ncbi:hypothetical protein [Nocardia bovistercoris]|uniref:Uncharacterized protein n=1 Tax=Nocardia bovistercoris TaxID=2785916 RepID=A0A931ICF0_9NOCA|nr:hypothetical protein [Nocardia bovistercoris]MBH0777280.1 hypothetical protein [Nocardia bovistercoris]
MSGPGLESAYDGIGVRSERERREALHAFYSARTADPVEAEWRTDYARFYFLADSAEGRSGYADADDYAEQAREVRRRWVEDPRVEPLWSGLDRARAELEVMVPYGEERGDMPGEAPPGMDPTMWRSQLQARDLTGHGRWAEPHANSDRERTEPTRDDTRRDQAEQAEEFEEFGSRTEQVMRADFVHAVSIGAWTSPWLGREDDWPEHFVYLSGATNRWRRDPEAADQFARAQAHIVGSPIQQRSEEQARWIAESGVERDPWAYAESPYVQRALRLGHVPGAEAAPTASRTGNALARAMSVDHTEYER